MLDKIDSIARNKPVSSEDFREIADGLLSESINNYHFLAQVKGLVNNLTACIELTNTGALTVLAATTKEDLKSFVVNAFTDPIFPTSVPESKYAERSTEFVSIYGNRLSSTPAFTDNAGNILSTVDISRTTILDNMRTPDLMIETDIENVLISGMPYVVRYQYNNMSPTLAELQIDITATGEPILINALRWIPMPAAGSVLLKSITYNGAYTFAMNGGTTIPAVTDFTVERSTHGYFHFEPIELTSLKLVLESQVYISSLKALAIGISKIIGELNTYASTSYIGYKIDYPEDCNTLNSISILPAGYSKSVENIRVKLYDNLNDFNAMNNNYIVSGSSFIETTISSVSYPNLYALVELQSVNNTTPCLGQMKFSFA